MRQLSGDDRAITAFTLSEQFSKVRPTCFLPFAGEDGVALPLQADRTVESNPHR
jgi:hypothetical protein